MEETLEVYQRPYDAQRPLICFDEGTKQLVKDVRTPLPATPGRRERIDYEYERNGTGNLFMMFEPLVGRREVLVTERRTAVDYAAAIQHLVDVSYPRAEKIVLIQDNLNTHKLASLYEAFPPEEARRLINKLEVHYTPKHGSWLNMAEIELRVLRGQCLDRRIPDFATLTSEVTAWQSDRNAVQVKVNWQFTTADARVKLQRLYPVLEPVKNKETNH
jgi:DDE superfamily endonuclease